jgi:hypothetical protein
MPQTTNLVHLEAQLRETITSEETHTKRWEQAYGSKIGTAEAVPVRHIWDPNALSQEAKLFARKGRSEVRASVRAPHARQHAHLPLRTDDSLPRLLPPVSPHLQYSVRKAPTSIVQGSQYEWANPSIAQNSLCRSELMQHRRRELASATDAQCTGGLSLRLDRPAFGPNERYNTWNSAGVIGQASPYAIPERPRYGRTTWLLSSSVESRNDATQLMFTPRTTGGMERATADRLFS